MRLQSLDLPVFHNPVFMLAISTIATLIGVKMITAWTVSAWLAGQSFLLSLLYKVKVDLLYNAKDAASFYSGCCIIGTNPDLGFANIGSYSHLSDRYAFEKFSRSQHQPLLINHHAKHTC